jgi:hypothetical protein
MTAAAAAAVVVAADIDAAGPRHTYSDHRPLGPGSIVAAVSAAPASCIGLAFAVETVAVAEKD